MRALIFDCGGVLADTERARDRQAFIEELHAPKTGIYRRSSQKGPGYGASRCSAKG